MFNCSKNISPAVSSLLGADPSFQREVARGRVQSWKPKPADPAETSEKEGLAHGQPSRSRAHSPGLAHPWAWQVSRNRTCVNCSGRFCLGFSPASALVHNETPGTALPPSL